MPAFVNPLDRVPQIRVDYANHVVYGGALGAVVALWFGWGVATLAVLVVAAIKKTVDYFREHESATECLAKALVTAAVPAVVVAIALAS